MTNREIYIATAPKRMTPKWRNKKITWAELQERCSKTLHTNETLAEFKAMPKDEQSNIKDVGGFVGGYLTNGRRAKGYVSFRDVLTLDIDYGVSDVWEGFTMAFDCASFCYSTHKHTSSKPRIRLVLLLSRSVTPEEYEAVGRAVAVRVGIELFDDTTYEPERLMYWPSTSKDGEFYFQSQEGEALDPDEILSTYHDWHDTSEWAFSKRVVEKVQREATKQGCPTEKPGIVGSFCRCYNIHEAIAEFLSDVYTPAGADRYTYVNGTVAAGLVVYENGNFAYSHNNTDPCSQRLVNAFDLVRLHKYAVMDEDVDSKVAINNRPSYKAMSEFASKDSAVRKDLMSARMKSAVNDFGELMIDEPTAEVEESDDWLEMLDYTKKGTILNTIANASIIIAHAPELRGRLWFDEFTGLPRYNGRLPWRDKADGGSWDQSDFACLRKLLEKYGITGKDRIKDAFLSVCNANRKHPVRDYLRSLTWDSVPRLDSLFVDFLGAEDSDLVRQQTRKQFVAAVARIMHPGCKFDYMLVLVGKEGTGKSTILSKLAGSWFNDSLVTMEGKEGMESLRGAWILEIGELMGMKRSEVESVKAYLSKQVDVYRPAYGEVLEEHPRQCVFFGTTNETNFLKGFTGNRRFWVVPTGVSLPRMDIFNDLTEDYRDQVWAEAVSYYDNNEPLFLPAELEIEARRKQSEYNELTGDERIGIIKTYLDKRLPLDWCNYSIDRRRAFIKNDDPLSPDGISPRNIVCSVEILSECFGQQIDDKTKYKTREINAMLKQIDGWEEGPKMQMGPYGQQRTFKRIEPIDPNDTDAL